MSKPEQKYVAFVDPTGVSIQEPYIINHPLIAPYIYDRATISNAVTSGELSYFNLDTKNIGDALQPAKLAQAIIKQIRDNNALLEDEDSLDQLYHSFSQLGFPRKPILCRKDGCTYEINEILTCLIPQEVSPNNRKEVYVADFIEDEIAAHLINQFDAGVKDLRLIFNNCSTLPQKNRDIFLRSLLNQAVKIPKPWSDQLVFFSLFLWQLIASLQISVFGPLVDHQHKQVHPSVNLVKGLIFLIFMIEKYRKYNEVIPYLLPKKLTDPLLKVHILVFLVLLSPQVSSINVKVFVYVHAQEIAALVNIIIFIRLISFIYKDVLQQTKKTILELKYSSRSVRIGAACFAFFIISTTLWLLSLRPQLADERYNSTILPVFFIPTQRWFNPIPILISGAYVFNEIFSKRDLEHKSSSTSNARWIWCFTVAMVAFMSVYENTKDLSTALCIGMLTALSNNMEKAVTNFIALQKIHHSQSYRLQNQRLTTEIPPQTRVSSSWCNCFNRLIYRWQNSHQISGVKSGILN